jgi:GT2 family glycosyltransferase
MTANGIRRQDADEPFDHSPQDQPEGATHVASSGLYIPSISVVICAYTEARWDELTAAVQSVAHQTNAARETIVVIDHNDALLARAREAFTDAIVIANGARQGLSGARNTGVAVATGDVVAFLDDDATAERDWLEHLAAPYRDPNVLGVGGEILPAWQVGKPAFFPTEFYWVVGCTYTGLPDEQAEIRNMIGANMSVRRDVLNETGGFSDVIGRVGTRPVGCEETELCIRAKRGRPQGRFIYEPAATVHHLVPKSRSGWHYFVNRCWAEGLSKAVVSRLAGAQDGLSSERAHVLRTLPRGVWQGLVDARHGDRSGLARSAAIVLGLAVTTGGYLFGMVRGVKDVGGSPSHA